MTKVKRLIPLLVLTVLVVQGARPEIYYPWREVYIGALEGKSWAGLVLTPERESAFAFRLRIRREDRLAEGEDLFYLISECGPHAPDGGYARIKLDLALPFNMGGDTPVLKKPSRGSETLVLEWSRQDERTVVGRIIAPKNIEVHLIQYFPWDFKGVYRLLPDGQVAGLSPVPAGRHYLFWANRMADAVSSDQEEETDELTLYYTTEKERLLHFVVGVGEDARILSNHIYRYKNQGLIDRILNEEEERYKKKRVKVEGMYAGPSEAITNNLFWMILYQAGEHRLYTPAGRRWIFPKPDGTPDHWTIFEWDSFFNALELVIESPKHAKDILKAVLETQYPNGNIPNWRGRFGGTSDRSQPPVGSYVVLKLFQRLGDIEILEHAYPYLRRWHAFWKEEKMTGLPRRDGNGDGLLEWGSDDDLVAEDKPEWEENVDGKQRALWESGQDDLPNWDDAGFDTFTSTMTMNCVDLNSLYALDAWCLSQIARILNKREEYEDYLAEYENMKDLVNNLLWDEKEGFYFDRHWDGRFSTRKASSNFYPLLARIPDKDRALLMVRRLLNSSEFWGEYVIPTISRDDPAFKDQEYWRGTVWPPTNYLIYQGLKAYGFDAIASEFARKSLELFLRTWKNFQLCPENFDSRTGEPKGRRYQSWGPLFALIAVEDYLDVNPWEGFRFGMIQPEKSGKLKRISFQGRHYDVEISPSEIKLKEEGRDIIKANGGAVFRHFFYSEEEISFEVKSLEKRTIEIRFLAKGRYQLRIDDQIKDIFKGNSLKFQVPEGEHSVLILLLDRL